MLQIRTLSVALIGMGVSYLFATQPTTGNAKLPCEEAQAWVLQNRAGLPSDIETLALLPMAYRKAVYAELAPELKRGLWRDHIMSFVSELTPDQQAKAQLLLGSLDRYILEDKEAVQGRAALEADGWTKERLVAEFGDLASTMFSRLGPADDDQMPDCACSTDSDWCPHDASCDGSNVECKTTRSGCGTLWCYPCDGLCYS